MFGEQLLIGSAMIVATVVFHVAGLVYLARWIRGLAAFGTGLSSNLASTLLLVASVLAIIGLHTVEAWAWAALYLGLGEFAHFERSLYFSVVTATTLGYGDITLSGRWQLLSTFEAMGGLLLFGASTAFLLGLMRHMFEERDIAQAP